MFRCSLPIECQPIYIYIYMFATISRPPSGLQLEQVLSVLHVATHRAQRGDSDAAQDRSQDCPIITTTAVGVRWISDVLGERRWRQSWNQTFHRRRRLAATFPPGATNCYCQTQCRQEKVHVVESQPYCLALLRQRRCCRLLSAMNWHGTTHRKGLVEQTHGFVSLPYSLHEV